MSVCRILSPPGNHPSRGTEDFWSNSILLILARYNNVNLSEGLEKYLSLHFCCGFRSLRTRLLCIVGELAWGGYVAALVGISDRWKVTGDRSQVTRNMWHMTHDLCWILLVLVLLSTHVEKLTVSRMQDFCNLPCSDQKNCSQLSTVS